MHYRLPHVANKSVVRRSRD